MHKIWQLLLTRLICQKNQTNQPTKDHLGVSSWCNGYIAGLWKHSKRVRTPVTLLRSLSDKYAGESHEPHYPLSYGLNSTFILLLAGWIWH